jgi:dTDP-6-deoxy-L-talose 4-dehydrogenase (NAD+)
MKIAIIGGTSFIGQSLISRLKKKNLIATYNSNKILNDSKVKWKKLDFRNKKKNFFKYLNYPDIVINLAWADIPKYNLKKHFKTFYYQKRLNLNLINNGLKNLIILGTCYEYGKINGRISENEEEKPNTAYGKAKLMLLRNILKLKRKKKFKLTWLRPFFIYGLNKKRVTLFSLIKQLNENKISKLNVSGDLVRDFVPVSFLCSTINRVIELNKDLGIVNLCSGRGISIKNFIKKNLTFNKNLKKINMNSYNPNSFEPKAFWGDNRKLKKILSN